MFPRRKIRKVCPRFEPRRHAKPDISNLSAPWCHWLHELWQLWPELFPQTWTMEPKVLGSCSRPAGSGRVSRRGSCREERAPSCRGWTGRPSLEERNKPVWSSRSCRHKPGYVRKHNVEAKKPGIFSNGAFLCF